MKNRPRKMRCNKKIFLINNRVIRSYRGDPQIVRVGRVVKGEWGVPGRKERKKGMEEKGRKKWKRGNEGKKE